MADTQKPKEMAQSKNAVVPVTDISADNSHISTKDASKETSGCPLEKVLEFLEAVMTRKYKTGLALAKEVMLHEPNNELVKEYMLVLRDLVEADEEEEDSDSSCSTLDSSENDSDTSLDDSSWESRSSTSDENDDYEIQIKEVEMPSPTTEYTTKTK